MPSQTTTAAQHGNVSTPKNEKNTLLGLPSEIRITIYQYLFPPTSIHLVTSQRWNAAQGRHENIAQGQEHVKPMIDDGITLTCSLLRAESLPVVRQSLTLECKLVRCVAGQIRFCVKSHYLEPMREALIVFDNLDHCDLPFHELPSLEQVEFFFFVFDEHTEPLPITVSAEIYRQWGRDADTEGLLKTVKGNILLEAQGSRLHDVLMDTARCFTVVWTDQVCCKTEDNQLGWTVWLTFEWDALQLLLGDVEIQEEWSKILEDEAGTSE